MSENGNGHQNGNGEIQQKPVKHSGPKFTRAEVRDRRRIIEEMLLMPMRPLAVWHQIKKQYPIEYATFRDDVCLIHRYWKADDKKRSGQLREEAIRRYERKLRKTESEKRWTANIGFEALLAKAAGFGGEGPLIAINKTNVKAVVNIQSRVNTFIANIPKDERRRLAESLALANRELPVAPGIAEGVPRSLADRASPGTEPHRAEDSFEGSD